MNETVVVRQTNQLPWNQGDERPDLRAKFLVDSTETNSHGLSCGILEVAVGGELPLHHHGPQEIYVIRSGKGLLLKSDGETQPVGADDVVYVPENGQHGIRNVGDVPLEFLWIFPTDCWQEVEYLYAEGD